jgi:hypothetical protein
MRYSPQANTMSVAGEDNKPHEIPFLGKSFAMDPETASMGWLLIDEGVRDWKPFPIGDVVPPSPGPNYKRGFAMLVYAPKLLGSPEAHEMCSSTGAYLSFCERLYNECEPQFGRNQVPIVRITEAEPIKLGKGKSRELKFEIVQWVPRPAAMIEALAKLKAANTTPNVRNGAANADYDNFDDDDLTAAPPNEEPPPDRAEAEQPKSSDILDDEIPF